MASIGLHGITKVFDDGTCAVEALDLEVADGEFAVLVGPSGSGKTTVLRMVAGLEEASGGAILIGERDVTDVAPRDRDIAMVFQSYALYPHMSVADNMGFGLRLRGLERGTVRHMVGRAAHRLGVQALLARRPRQLSGGQRQRVALGRAVVRAPQAFLMDEPLSNLDAKLRVEMRAYLAQLHAELGTTTLYVTHDQTEAMTMADRVAVMRDGRLEQVDAPQALYDRPLNLFVAGFIGSPSMNLLRARLEGEAGAPRIVIGSQTIVLPEGVLARRGGLGARLGSDVVVGIRPESLAPANGAPADRVLELPVVLTEALGSDALVHLDTDAPAVLTGDLLEAARELGGERARTGLVARVPPQAAAAPGEKMRLAVDVEALHFFDPDSERALR